MRCFVYLLLSISLLTPSFAKDIQTVGVPEGFEEFFEPQTTAVDVYFGGVFRVSTLATYTPDALTFESIDEVLVKLPIKDDTERVRDVLSQSLRVNDDYICDSKKQCDTPTPEVASIVFDESKFRVDLFINSDFLFVNSHNDLKFLPQSKTPFSYVNNLTANVSGASGQDTNASLFGQSLLSRYNGHINSNWVVGGNQNFKFNQVYGQYDQAGYQSRVGFLNTSNRYFDFVSSQPYLGGSFSTSFNTRKDLDFISTIPIQIYLPTRSRVSIRKDGVVLSSKFYDAGNHNLDTSGLPSGAYTVQIEINGLDGKQEIKEHFYVKTTSLPPAEVDLYYAEVGIITQKTQDAVVPESVEDEYFIRGAYSHRLANDLGVDVGLAYGYGDTVLESGLYYYNKGFNFRPKLMIADENRYGVGLYGFTQFAGATVSYHAQQIWGEKEAETNDTHSLLLGEGSRHVFSVNKSVFDGVASLQWSSIKTSASDTNNGIDLSYKRSVFRQNNSTVDASFLISKTDDSRIYSLGIEWRQKQNKVNHTTSLNHRQMKTESNTADTSLLYTGRLPNQMHGSQSYSAQWRALSSHDAKSMGASGKYANNYVRASTNIEKGLGEKNDAFLYNASLATSIVGNADEISFGGNEAAHSALIMNIEGTADEAEFDVFVNDKRKATANVGDVVVVPVQPFETYDIKLKDIGSEFIAFDDKTVSHTVYPGNVPSVDFRADKLVVVIGTLYKACSELVCEEPVGDARINGSHEWTATDSNGDFQMEVSPANLKNLVAETREFKCKIELPDIDIKEPITYFEEPVFCK